MTLRYCICPADPGAHLFHVTLELDDPDPQGQILKLPAWIPGSYLVRDFARHIVRLRALDGTGRRVRVAKTDKHTWRCAPLPSGATLRIAYEVYAHDLSVRGAHLDTTHGFFNGPSVFLLAPGREQEPCRVDIIAPPGRAHGPWRVATALRAARGTVQGNFGTYRAADYAELIDSPVELGRFAQARFALAGVEHTIAVTGRVAKLDLERVARDLETVCAWQARLFEPRSGRPPFAHYTFLVTAVDEGYGGLEHCASTALLCRRDDLPHVGMLASTEGYRRFLGLASHEYFHAWNVKRIRPAAFIPYDLFRENYTPLLWLFEGFTAYYDDLALCRAGLLTPAQYLQTLGTTLTTVLQRSGRRKQSLAESSFDAWIKYYRPDENTPNSGVSYYQKGALVAAALDLTIRTRTRGRRSLDDLMRLLWRRHTQAQKAGTPYPGVQEADVGPALAEATGVDLGAALRSWTQGTADPDFEPLFAAVGIDLARGPVVDSPQFALLGLRLAPGERGAIAHVFDGGPAQAAGLAAGDQLIALGGLRAEGARLDRLLARHAPGERVEVLAFRRDELLRFELALAPAAPAQWKLALAPRASATALRLRRGWLGAG